MAKKAVVLLSGGLDSATVLAIARSVDGMECYALSFGYGQRHSVELEAAADICSSLGGAEHRIVDLDPRAFSGSALTDTGEVPHGRGMSEITSGEVPATYVPARNTIFLSFALGWAEVLGARSIYIGVNALDYSGYPDCRPEFIEQFQRLADVATKATVRPDGSIRIRAPLLHMSKADIIRAGSDLGVDYSLTVSCYSPEGRLACGNCDSCVLRSAGFEEAGVMDPTRYMEAV